MVFFVVIFTDFNAKARGENTLFRHCMSNWTWCDGDGYFTLASVLRSTALHIAAAGANLVLTQGLNHHVGKVGMACFLRREGAPPFVVFCFALIFTFFGAITEKQLIIFSEK